MKWLPKTSRQIQGEIDEHQARARLIARARKLLDKWEPILGVNVGEVHVRKMKSYWASINEHDKRMWVSPELANQPPKFMEYVVVHELAHIVTDSKCKQSGGGPTCGGHDAKFYEIMDRNLPGWRKQHALYAGPMTQHS
jgi:predicted metal-dependent hydrolase